MTSAEGDVLDLLRRLSDRDRDVLRLLDEHSVLTAAQIADLAFGSLRSAQRRMAALAAMGAAGRFRRRLPAGSEPWKYYLGHGGSAVIAAEHGRTPPTAAKVRARAVALAASQRLGHLLGCNAFFASLAATARQRPDCALVAWRSERRCADVVGDVVRPDGYAEWASDGVTRAFFFEHDTGSETAHRVADKLLDYHRLATELTEPVTVLFWLSSLRRETSVRTAMTNLGPVDSVTAVTATPAFGPPHEAIWLPLRAPRRLTLSDLPAGWSGV